METHVQANTANSSNLALRQRGQNARDGLRRVSHLARAQNRSAGERAHRNLLALVKSQSNI